MNQKDPKPPTLTWSQPPAAAQQSQKITPPSPKAPVTLTPPTYGRGMLAGSFVAGLILGVLFGWGWFSLRVSPSGTATSTATSTEEAKSRSVTETDTKTNVAAPVVSTGLKVASQNAGLRVSVSGVSVSKPTWVVVYENAGGKPGNALGAKLFFPVSQGGTTSGSVTLLRATRSNQTYFVGQHVDNGDGKFSKTTDKAVTDDGDPVIVSFKTN